MKEKISKKGIKKRLFSVVLALAMVLSLMPNLTMTVHAASENYTLYLKADGTATKNDASGEAVTSLPAGLSYDSGTGVWTMNNFSFITTKANAVIFEATDCKLNIVGNNTINSADNTYDNNHQSKGLECKNLTIAGEGTLNIKSGNTGSGANTSYGIMATTLTVDGGNVIVIGGAAKLSYGIQANSLTVNGGSVSVTKNGEEDGSAINAGTITIKEGLKVVAGANAGTATKPTFNTDWKTTLKFKRYVKIGTSGHELGDDSAKSQPKTGVMDTLPMWFGVMAVSAAAYVLTSKKRFF